MARSVPLGPEQISVALRRYAGDNARIGIETGAMTPWIVHELRNLGFDVICLDARHARAALKMQINKNDQNDAEGLAQIVRTGWYRSVHVKSFDSHRARAILGARTQLVGMTTRLSNHIRGVLKTFDLLPGAMRGLPFDRKVEVLLEARSDVAPIVRPMLVAWRQLRVRSRLSIRRSAQWCEWWAISPADERAWHWRAVGARLCQHRRRSVTFFPVTIGRRAPRAYATPISIGRSRSERPDIAVWRHPRSNADVRGCRGDPDRVKKASSLRDWAPRSPSDRGRARRELRWPESFRLSLHAFGVRENRSAGQSRKAWSSPSLLSKSIRAISRI